MAVEGCTHDIKKQFQMKDKAVIDSLTIEVLLPGTTLKMFLIVSVRTNPSSTQIKSVNGNWIHFKNISF